ncbi:MAG TPA: TIM44-like domain-containing protein [Thermoanaerobaculia bacterium]|nr:TIM44-like domain-containing protein [Thermoanaerobaculia bacterium]
MKPRALSLPALALCLLLLAPGLAVARPGGGHSYHGSSHSSGGSHSSGSHGSFSGGSHGSPSSGGIGGSHTYVPVPVPVRPSYRQSSSSGGGCLGGIFLLFLLLVILVVVILVLRNRRAAPIAPPVQRVPPDLNRIRALDPEFSAVLFEDFAYDLYARAHAARSNPAALETLAPYLSEGARQELASRPPAGAPVSNVIVGALHLVDLALPAPGAGGQVVVVLDYEANLTVGAGGAGGRTQYLQERWTLVRDAGVKSRPPEQVESFHCPNCGAPFQSAGGGRCDYCGQVVTDGRFNWSVQTIELLESEDRPPALTGTVEEEGTDFPTVYHPEVAARRAELLAADPAATDEAITARLRLIYDQLNTAWSNLDLKPIRPYVSDSLFEYLQYWIDAYRQQGLQNVLEGMRITRITLAKVIRDKHFDALTFRLWGTGHDYTVRQDNRQIVGGNSRTDRVYSEYWTLIRGAGVRGAPSTERTCPNCAAPLSTNMAGDCEHCGAKLTRGDFDWVLSKIEQDDSYSG